jgi:hypothetical protein
MLISMIKEGVDGLRRVECDVRVYFVNCAVVDVVPMPSIQDICSIVSVVGGTTLVHDCRVQSICDCFGITGIFWRFGVELWKMCYAFWSEIPRILGNSAKVCPHEFSEFLIPYLCTCIVSAHFL